MFSHDIGKTLIYLGAALIVVGLIVQFGGKFFHLGRLPGDFKWESGNFGVYFPLATSLLLSVVLTIACSLFWRK